MSKTSKKQVSEQEYNEIIPETSGIVSGIMLRPEKDYEPITDKIVFLGKDNLEKLRGYKAFLNLLADGTITIRITGLSPKGGLALFKSIGQMKDEEIHGE